MSTTNRHWVRQAAINGDVEELRRELAIGHVIDEYDIHGMTLLHFLCAMRPGGDRLACFHLLIEAGADPTKRTRRGGWFPLLFAAEQAHTELCAALLASSAQVDLNRGNNVGVMPLHCACRSDFTSRVECVALLLSRGASVNARTLGGGTTPLYIATSNRRRRLYPVLLRAGAVVPAPGTTEYRTIDNSHLHPMDRRQADHLYLRKVAAAGGYRNYARDHLNSLANIFSPKFSCRGLPPEMVRRVVEYAFDVGAHFRGH